MRFGRYDCNDVKKIEDWSKYSEFDLVFKKKKFKKGELANLLTSVLEDSRFDEEGFNINGRLNNKNLEDTSELVYEELDIKNIKFTFKILNNIYNKITNDKKIIKNINLLIEFGLSKTLGIDTSKLGKLTKKNKKGRLTRNKHFNAGEYGQIPSKDLIKFKLNYTL